MGMRGWVAMGAVAAGLVAPALPGQTMARRNWSGSGITVAAWWRGAEFYAIDPISFQDSDGDGYGDLNGITSRLGYLSGLGVEALVLTPFELTAGGETHGKVGTEEDFARLVAEATHTRMRVLVDVPVDAETPAAQTLGVARYWLTRGAAGIWVSQAFGKARLAGGQRGELERALDGLCGSFAGQRVAVFADAGPAQTEPERAFRASARRRPKASGRDSRTAGAAGRLIVDERLARSEGVTFALLRQAVALPETTLLATDAAFERRSLAHLGAANAKLLAAVLLLGEATPVLLYGQEIGMASGTAGPGMPAPMQWGGAAPFTTGQPWIEYGPNAATANVETEDAQAESLLSWYKRLGALRLGEPALHGGPVQVLSGTAPEVVAWERRSARQGDGAPGKTLVVVGNVSSRAVYTTLPGAGALKVLAASWNLDGAVPVSGGFVVPAGGVLVGEMRRGPGLEAVVLPPRHRH